MYYIYVYCHNIHFSVCPLFFIIILTLFLLVSLCYLFWPDDLWVYSALLRWTGHDLWLRVIVMFQLGLGRRTHRSEFSASSFSLVLFPFSFFLIFYLYLYLFSVGFSLISLFVWSKSPSSPFLRFYFFLMIFSRYSYLSSYLIAAIIYFLINFVSFLKSASVSPRGRPHCTSFVTLGAAAAQR